MAIVATHIAAVQQLYVAYFGRPADTAGLDYWTNIVEANAGKTTAVSATFAASPEYSSVFAGMTNTQIVDKIYSNLFGRPADTAGRDYWVALLANGQIKVDTIVAEVAVAAVGTDKEAVENKVAGATAFTGALDTAAEQAGYTGSAALTLAKAFITGITSDATLTTATATPALNATVSAVVVAGTPFTVVGALQSLETAQKAEAAFLVTADGDKVATTSATEASLDAAVVTKTAAVSAALDADVRATYNAGSVAVKTAIIADQQAENTTKLATEQTAVATAQANIAKVAGLQSAVTTLAGAKTALTASTDLQKANAATLASELAFYNSTNTETKEVAADGTVAGLIELKAGKLALISGITETNEPGVTALLNASIAKENSDVAVTNANTVVNASQASVDFLDTTPAELTALANLSKSMTSFTFAEGVYPTEIQIAEQLSIFQAADTGESSVYENFVTAVNTYRTNDNTNPLSETLTDSQALVTATTKTIKTLNDAVVALKTAEANVTSYDALHASVMAASKVFGDNGYTLQNVDAAFEIGSAASDIFMVGKVNSSISLFDLQGSDSLYIGSGYVLNTGALTTGNNSALEAFVSQVGADTVIQVETSAFGSGATTPEIVTITLVGVDAAGITLNNGIITA